MLIPEFLNFMKGIVDSEALPLNISLLFFVWTSGLSLEEPGVHASRIYRMILKELNPADGDVKVEEKLDSLFSRLHDLVCASFLFSLTDCFFSCSVKHLDRVLFKYKIMFF